MVLTDMNEMKNMSVDGQSLLDDRWLMSYMACLTDHRLDYYDSGKNLSAHPLFPVCVEWPRTKRKY